MTEGGREIRVCNCWNCVSNYWIIVNMWGGLGVRVFEGNRLLVGWTEAVGRYKTP